MDRELGDQSGLELEVSLLVSDVVDRPSGVREQDQQVGGGVHEALAEEVAREARLAMGVHEAAVLESASPGVCEQRRPESHQHRQEDGLHSQQKPRTSAKERHVPADEHAGQLGWAVVGG